MTSSTRRRLRTHHRRTGSISITGGTADDSIIDEFGDDTITGGEGDDWIVGRAGQ